LVSGSVGIMSSCLLLAFLLKWS